MKQKGIILACVFALLLALGLVGCGKSPAEEFGPNFTGEWELVSATGDSKSVDAETLELLKEHDLSVSLALNEDGTYVFKNFDDTMQGNWEATAEDTATMEMSGQTVNVTLANGKITVDQGGNAKLVFARANLGAASSGAASSEAASSGDASSEADESAAAEAGDEDGANEGDANEGDDASSSQAA